MNGLTTLPATLLLLLVLLCPVGSSGRRWSMLHAGVGIGCLLPSLWSSHWQPALVGLLWLPVEIVCLWRWRPMTGSVQAGWLAVLPALLVAGATMRLLPGLEGILVGAIVASLSNALMDGAGRGAMGILLMAGHAALVAVCVLAGPGWITVLTVLGVQVVVLGAVCLPA